MDISIHTINARGNCMLEVIRNHFDLSNAQMFQEINSLALSTIDILKNKGIDYKQLRSSLVPQTNRCEAGFIFDTQKIKSHSYGIEVIKKILPLLNLKSNNCILCGDLVGDDQNFIFTLLQESLILSRDLNFVHGSALYCVYINNLSESSLEEIHNALSSCDFYAGFILGKFSSRAKIYLSTILVKGVFKLLI